MSKLHISDNQVNVYNNNPCDTKSLRIEFYSQLLREQLILLKQFTSVAL